MTDRPATPQAILDAVNNAERAMLGAVLTFPEAIKRIKDVDPCKLRGGYHRRILREMQALHAQNKPIDLITLESRGIPLKALTDLPGGIAANIRHHANIVLEEAARNDLLLACAKIVALTRERELPPADVIQEGLQALRECYQAPSKIRHISEHMTSCLERLKRRQENPDMDPPGVPLAIPQLNSALMMGGVPRGHLTLIAGDTSAGKSAFLNSALILPAALKGARILLVTLEDDGDSVGFRQLSVMTRLCNKNLQQEYSGRQITPVDWTALVQAATRVSETGIYVLDEQMGSVNELVQSVERFVEEHAWTDKDGRAHPGADIVAIDYLQYVQSGEDKLDENAESRVVLNAIGRDLTRSPVMRRTATVLASQYRERKDEDKPPMNKEIRGVKLISQFARCILHIWTPSAGKGYGCQWVIIGKNTNGPGGMVPVGWTPSTVTFGEPDKQHLYNWLTAIGKTGKFCDRAWADVEEARREWA